MMQMNNKGYYTLRVDPQFRELIRPLYKSDYLQLEKSIISEGCKEAIVIWNGIIVDGHNRYDICKRYDIPFAIIDGDFDSRDEIVTWICRTQLQRSDLPEEFRHYLIGKQYESEKAESWRNIGGNEPIGQPYLRDTNRNKNRTAIRMGISNRIAHENNVSRGTVEKYAVYAKAIDIINSKRPEMAKGILSGSYKVSHINIIELSKLSSHDLIKVQRKIERMQQDSVKFNQIRYIIDSSVSKKNTEMASGKTSVKDMPEFDPDSEVVGLTLTIPSWARSIDRVINKTDFNAVSDTAKNNLLKAILDIAVQIERIKEVIEGQ